jgi:hypothetical protein
VLAVVPVVVMTELQILKGLAVEVLEARLEAVQEVAALIRAVAAVVQAI